MRVLNFRARKFAIGKKVKLVMDFKSGSILLVAGCIGTIIGEHIENLPDMGLFNIRVLEIDFVKHRIAVGEAVADTYMEPL